MCIKNLIIVNNYGTIQFCDNKREVTFSAAKENNGALGPTYANFVNGRRVGNESIGSEATVVPNRETDEVFAANALVL